MTIPPEVVEGAKAIIRQAFDELRSRLRLLAGELAELNENLKAADGDFFVAWGDVEDATHPH